MKYCENFAALLDPFIDGELSPEEMARVQAHLDECPACRSYVDDALAIRAAFPDAEETELPERFAENVMARIQAEAAPRAAVQKQRSRSWLKALVSLAACCAIVLLAAPMFSGDGKAEAPAAAASTAAAPAERAMGFACTEGEAGESAGEPQENLASSKLYDAAPASGVDGGGEPAVKDFSQDPEPYTYAVSETVYTAILNLPSEGVELMAAYTPVSENDTVMQYELTAQEADALLVQLETASFSYQSEDGIAPTTDLVLVVVSK